MADEVLSPFVYWGQSQHYIYLKVDLNGVKDEKIELDDEKLILEATALGSNGRKRYACKIEFYLNIDDEKSQYRITDRNIELQLRKIGTQQWPRLTYDSKKPPWLKIDFDRFTFDDSSSEDHSDVDVNTMDQEEYMRKIEKEIQASTNPGTEYLDMKFVYMAMFNLFQWVGYSMVFTMLIYRVLKDGPEARGKAWSIVSDQLTTVQLAAILEVLHPLLGWVKTGAFMPFIQMFGRNLVLFAIIAVEPRIQQREVVWWLFVTWSSVEIVRFLYYFLNQIQREVWLVTWLRYTVWIVLYPIGFFCEGFVLILAVPYFEQSNKWTLELPNSLNFAFHFPTFLKCYMIAFLPGGYLLMKNMYANRKKKLGVTVSSKSKVKAS